MIVSLVQETCKLIQEVDDRENAKSVVESVLETLGALEALKEKIFQLQMGIQTLRPRLSPADLQKALETGAHCAAQIRRSTSQFTVQPRQKNELQVVQNQIQRTLGELHKAWMTYATGRAREPEDLYQIVCYLPEVIARKATYDELRRKLQTASETTPSSWQMLQAFDQMIEQFKQMLGEIEGLSEAVKAFLLKALNGTATLADITDEVLQWCRQGQHAQTFSVRFAR